MKGSLLIVSFFIVGTLCGLYHLIPYDFTNSKLSYYALCALMFCVGINTGIALPLLEDEEDVYKEFLHPWYDDR